MFDHKDTMVVGAFNMVIALIGARGLLWTLILREGSLTALERRREGSLTTASEK